MKGYIGIANNNWCSFLQSYKPDCVVFWRKKTIFKALQVGEYFYFLNRKLVKDNQLIVGRGKYSTFHILSSKDAWEEYGCILGYKDEKNFLENIKSIYKTDEVKLGCILLQDVIFFDNPVSLFDCGINFSPYIVSGKTINEEECKKLNYALERRNRK